jgi:hypothetical protein
VGPQETCRLAVELVEEFGEQVSTVAERAIVTLEAHAIAVDIAAKRFDPYAPIAIH